MTTLAPVVVDVTASSEGATTTPTIALPGSIVAGQRLIIFLSLGTAASVAFPAGWTELYDSAIGTEDLSIAYRDCDGSEGASIQPTLGSSTTSAWAIFRLERFDPAQAPEAGAGSRSAVLSTAADSPSLTPSWGSDTNLWLSAFAAAAATPGTISAYPANYTLNQTYSAGAAGAYLGVAGRSLAATSENPDAFTITPSDTWNANTVAVRGLTVTDLTVTNATLAWAGQAVTFEETITVRHFGDIETAFVQSYEGQVVTEDAHAPIHVKLPTREEIRRAEREKREEAQRRWPLWSEPERKTRIN